MMKNRFISASVNITDMDDEAKKYPIVTKVEKNVELNSVMSNSFGFGGTNATLVFEKYIYGNNERQKRSYNGRCK